MLRIATILAVLLLAVPARAEVPLTGYFTATKACPALQSISRETNPGNITLRPGAAYDLIAGNKDRPTHLWIVIPGAQPDRRWVAVDCGTRSTDAEGRVDEPTPPAPPPTYRGTQYILAVNWQPAFCELSPRKTECRNQKPNSFEASNFTLHGLWPQPRGNEYCDVSARDRFASEDGRWRDLPQLDLNLALRRDLDEVMPGSQSGLDRHEWTKHGTCYGTGVRQYYADALDLMLALNTSDVAELFAANIGKRITLSEVRAAFDSAFGPGAGERVRMTCAEDGNRTLITELTIGLTGQVDGPDSLPRLIAAASTTDGGCRSGQVDAVGLR
ncbi:ribonuclease [Devosia sp.]|uniref:ribonuclease T2 family protein n=1 Tax=Devosia sp. TaxID=1871048 RepID=UPI001AC6B534|nr:ribonuclease [Devosia sp.]MBN9334595.1 ribonuclease [Devosia sp.]